MEPGTAARPRLAVFRSLAETYAQVIDDVNHNTLVAASTLEPEVRAKIGDGSKMDAAKAVGEAVANKALAKGITQVVFDRNGYKYHGKVAALAGAAREAGLEF